MSGETCEKFNIEKVFFPGEKVCAADDSLICGLGTYIKEDTIVASLYGRASLHKISENVSSIQVGSGKPYIPQLYNIVLCKVIDISNGTCKCQIIGTENNLYNSPFIGIIRKEFIKKAPNQMDIDISTCFKPGDILLARVLSLGDSSFYILSTLEDNLGVVVAHTEDGKIMSVIDRERMKCPETKEIEPRKVANVMFKRKSQTTSDNQD